MNARNALMLLGLVAMVAIAHGQSKGDEVMLRFAQPVSSKTAKAGDKIKFTVIKTVGNLKAGTPVTGVIERVDKKDHFGKNARIRLVLSPVSGVTLAPRDKGKPFVGSNTDKAAIASGAGAMVFGPLGLVGGYFITGKAVNIKKGDTLRTEVIR